MHPYSRFAGLPPKGEASFKPTVLPSANLRSYEIETETEIEAKSGFAAVGVLMPLNR